MLKKIRALTEQYAIPATFIAYILIDLLLLGLGRLLSSLPKTLPMEYLGEILKYGSRPFFLLICLML